MRSSGDARQQPTPTEAGATGSVCSRLFEATFLLSCATGYRRFLRLRVLGCRRIWEGGHMTDVAVLSRQGAQSLEWDDMVRLDRVANVRYHMMDDAPSRTEAAMLLRGTEIVASTNKCLPVLDAALLDRLPD